MKPINWDKANQVLKGGGDVADLPVRGDTYVSGERFVESCWALSWRDRVRALFRGRVYLVVLGATQPPVYLSTEPTP